jgi:serine/threonine-protein kinase
VAAGAAVLVLVVALAALANNRADTPSHAASTGSTGSTGSSGSAAPSETPSRTPSATPSRSESTSPSPSATADDLVTVDPAAYVGRPKDEAKKDLEDLGLEVDDTEVDNPGDQEKDTVADVSPSGQVEPDSTVTLSVYGDPPKQDNPGNGNGNDNGKGNDD